MARIEIKHATIPVPPGFALWNLGFRPFYLLASAFAALSILLWVAQYAGYLPAAYLQGPAWHSHEMLYGYTMAVVAGFLLTAVRNWTERPTPSGAPLAALAALWLAGRVLVLTPFATAAAVANAAFPVVLRLAIPYREGRVTAYLEANAKILHREFTPTGTEIEALVDPADVGRVRDWIVEEL